VLKEEARRYRTRAAELERARAQQDAQLGQLQDALSRARATAAGGGGRQGGAEAPGALRKELEAKAKLLEVRQGVGALRRARGAGPPRP
jgi:hypothetical protein